MNLTLLSIPSSKATNPNQTWQCPLTVASSSICSRNSSSFGRLIHEMVSPYTNCSDNIGGSGWEGTLPLVKNDAVSLQLLKTTKHRTSHQMDNHTKSMIYTRECSVKRARCYWRRVIKAYTHTGLKKPTTTKRPHYPKGRRKKKNPIFQHPTKVSGFNTGNTNHRRENISL